MLDSFQNIEVPYYYNLTLNQNFKVWSPKAVDDLNTQINFEFDLSEVQAWVRPIILNQNSSLAFEIMPAFIPENHNSRATMSVFISD